MSHENLEIPDFHYLWDPHLRREPGRVIICKEIVKDWGP